MALAWISASWDPRWIPVYRNRSGKAIIICCRGETLGLHTVQRKFVFRFNLITTLIASVRVIIIIQHNHQLFMKLKHCSKIKRPYGTRRNKSMASKVRPAMDGANFFPANTGLLRMTDELWGPWNIQGHSLCYLLVMQILENIFFFWCKRNKYF